MLIYKNHRLIAWKIAKKLTKHISTNTNYYEEDKNYFTVFLTQILKKMLCSKLLVLSQFFWKSLENFTSSPFWLPICWQILVNFFYIFGIKVSTKIIETYHLPSNRLFMLVFSGIYQNLRKNVETYFMYFEADTDTS